MKTAGNGRKDKQSRKETAEIRKNIIDLLTQLAYNIDKETAGRKRRAGNLPNRANLFLFITKEGGCTVGVNTDKVKGRMRERGLTQPQTAAALCAAGVHCTTATLNNKLRGKTDFKVGEFMALMDVLKVDAVDEYLSF